MARIDCALACALVLCGALLVSPPATAQERNSCVQCHSRLPASSFVGVKSHGWRGSVHQKHGVTCDKCHGGDPLAPDKGKAHAGVVGSSDPQSPVYYKKIPATCGKCHGAEFYKFTQSRHYKILESTGRGPECVTCHGSMVTSILTPDTVAAVCERCHNARMGVFPYVPQKAKAVLLLLRESSALLDANIRLGRGKTAAVREAKTSLHSAMLDWHKFDLDSITAYLQEAYHSMEQASGGKPDQ
jgi:hypothetical protein